MRLALAQLNFTVGAFEQNFAKIDAAVSRAKVADAELLVFSEMAATGYPPRDLLNHARFIDLNLALLDRGVRGATLMALSNKSAYLVLSTGNKAELAVGECTL